MFSFGEEGVIQMLLKECNKLRNNLFLYVVCYVSLRVETKLFVHGGIGKVI